MLNNFCFHVYAQKSLFIAENCNGFFDILIITLSCEFWVHRAGSQLKMLYQWKLPLLYFWRFGSAAFFGTNHYFCPTTIDFNGSSFYVDCLSFNLPDDYRLNINDKKVMKIQLKSVQCLSIHSTRIKKLI